MKVYQAHKYADIVPEMTDEEFKELKSDIKESGLLEDIILLDGKILDGRHRYKACKELSIEARFVNFSKLDTKESPLNYVLSKNLKRRHLTSSQKAAIAVDAEDIMEKLEQEAKERKESTLKKGDKKPDKEEIPDRDKGQSRDKLAKNFDTNPRYIQDAKNIKEEDPEAHENIKNGKETISSYKNKKEKEEREKKKARKKKEFKKRAEEFDPSNGFAIHQGKFQEISKQFDDESFDHIVTDPPYGKKYTQLWDDLGKVAARVLKPSSFLVAMSGQITLPEAIENLSKHLNYYWTLSYIVPDDMPIVPLWERKIKAKWKPIVVFYKEPMKKQFEATADLIEGSGNVKDKHEWEQPTEDTGELIEKFTNPGDKLLDPMAGSGTTLVAAKNKKRECVGIEKEEKYIDIIKGRLV